MWCVPCIPVAQLYERVVEAGTFPAILVVTGLLFLLPQILLTIFQNTGSKIAEACTGGANMVVSFVVLFLMIRVRSNVRRHYNIPEKTCLGCEVKPSHYVRLAPRSSKPDPRMR